MRELGEALATIVSDSTPSSTASVVLYQVTATSDLGTNNLGGVRAVGSTELMGKLNSGLTDTNPNTARAVAAGDVTDFNKVLPGGSESSSAPSTYPTDASGNGGGGKLTRLWSA
jgi:hypothetical protein